MGRNFPWFHTTIAIAFVFSFWFSACTAKNLVIGFITNGIRGVSKIRPPSKSLMYAKRKNESNTENWKTSHTFRPFKIGCRWWLLIQWCEDCYALLLCGWGMNVLTVPAKNVIALIRGSCEWRHMCCSPNYSRPFWPYCSTRMCSSFDARHTIC